VGIRRDLSLTVVQLQRDAGELDHLGHHVIERGQGIQFRLLDEQRYAGEQRVAPAVVDVQVAVDHRRHVLDPQAQRGEFGLQRPPEHGAEILLGLVVADPDARVEQQQAAGIAHHVGGAHDLLPGQRGTLIYGRPGSTARGHRTVQP
jgi:hypothetical protein